MRSNKVKLTKSAPVKWRTTLISFFPSFKSENKFFISSSSLSNALRAFVKDFAWTRDMIPEIKGHLRSLEVIQGRLFLSEDCKNSLKNVSPFWDIDVRIKGHLRSLKVIGIVWGHLRLKYSHRPKYQNSNFWMSGLKYIVKGHQRSPEVNWGHFRSI